MQYVLNAIILTLGKRYSMFSDKVNLDASFAPIVFSGENELED